MVIVDAISELKILSDGLTLLYVEDNEGLRKKAERLIKKVFSDVITASNGEEGYLLFQKYKPQIVLTDIRMPKVGGIEMIEMIKKIDPSTQFIITSAFDDKEYLLKAIHSGVFEYLRKPVKVDELIDALFRCAQSISTDESSALFNTYMEDMLNYQSDILVLISNQKLIFVNQMFLDFFNVTTLDQFYSKHPDFWLLLLQHKGFLYNHDDINCLTEAIKEPGKLFHTKIADQTSQNRHFILKMHPLPKKKNSYIMSLNDITDLNLLSLFDSKAVEEDKKFYDRSTLVNLLNIIHKNDAEIKIHNFYKVLTITNLGLIAHIDQEHVILKTTYMQQKATQFQKNILISSDIFPSAILCEPILKIDFEQQTIIFKEMRFLPRNPTQRRAVRVVPEEHHSVSLFFENRKFYGDVTISDISIEAVKLEVNALPAGLKVKTKVNVDIVLEYDRKPLIINTPAHVLRIDEMARSFAIVLILELIPQHKKQIIDYVAKRQMNLIREFKGLQFG